MYMLKLSASSEIYWLRFNLKTAWHSKKEYNRLFRYRQLDRFIFDQFLHKMILIV